MRLQLCSRVLRCCGLVLLALPLAVPKAATLDVPGSYPTIQAGINAATAGDTVLVANGTYVGAGNVDITFNRNIVLLSQAGADATIIDGQNANGGVTFTSGVDATAVLDGFTITNCFSSNGVALSISGGTSPTIRNCKISGHTLSGNGPLIDSSGSPTFSNCTISGNTGTSIVDWMFYSSLGSPVFDSCSFTQNDAIHAVVFTSGAYTKVTNCTFTGNTALLSVVNVEIGEMTGCTISGNSAIGVAVDDTPDTLVVTDCTISDNTGAGVYFVDCSPVFANCTISGNGGGGIHLESMAARDLSPTFTDCLITGNRTSTDGGGVLVDGPIVADIMPVFEGCTIAGNEAADDGGGIYQTAYPAGPGTALVGLNRTIVWGNCAGGSGAEAMAEFGEIAFTCSDFDTLGLAGPGTITIGADNVFDDPRFCGPAACAGAPTTAGEYSLAGGSPCRAGNSPCGQLIGALDLGCGILSVSDVPDDQGRRVRVKWLRDALDEPMSVTPITEYSVWRKVAPPLPPAWDYVTTIPAAGDAHYNAVVPTLCDSTAGGVCWSTFFVRAHTASPTVFFDTDPDSGYSVDNLVPAVPQGLLMSDPGEISWSPNSDVDVVGYAVLAGEVESTQRDNMVYVGYTEEPRYLLPGWTAGKFIFVIALDDAGNESAPSEAVHNGDGAGAEKPTVPTRYALMQNVPNPFNPTTTVRFDLPEAAHVTLRIYDGAGRLVRTLVDRQLPRARHEVDWNGDSDRGGKVATGVYFYRLVAGDFVAARKMVLVK